MQTYFILLTPGLADRKYFDNEVIADVTLSNIAFMRLFHFGSCLLRNL